MKNKPEGGYILIENYQYNGLNVGRAFYDVQYDRIIFTNSTNKENQSAQLIKFDRDTAYFYSSAESIIWQVDINTGTPITRLTAAMVLGPDAEIVHISQKNEQIYITLTSASTEKIVEQTYRLIQDGKLELVSILNNWSLIDELFSTPTILSSEQCEKLGRYRYLIRLNNVNSNKHLEYISILPKIADTVMISGTDENGIWHHYWLRNHSGTLIKANVEREKIDEKQIIHSWVSITEDELEQIDQQLTDNIPLEKIWRNNFPLTLEDGIVAVSQLRHYKIQPTLAKIFGISLRRYHPSTNLWNWVPPKDLVLVGSLFNENGKEVFFFYSQKEDVIFRQEGLGQDIIDSSKPTALRLNFSQIENVVSWQDNLLIIQKNGVVKQLKVDGSSNTVALNENWFVRDTAKWNGLAQFINEEQPIALFGLKDMTNKRILPAWYFNGEIVIANGFSPESELQILDFSPDQQQSIIFDTKSKKLYQIKTMKPTQLNGIFDVNWVSKHPENLPKYMELYPKLNLKSVKKMVGGIMLLTEHDEIIYHPTSNSQQLGSSLIIKGTLDDDLFIPAQLNDVSILILSGGEGSDIYQFKKGDWKRFKTIIIDNYSVDRVVDEIVLPIENPLRGIFVNRRDNDLVITDSINDTSLYIREVYGSQAASYRHVQLKISDSDRLIDISVLAERLLVRHGLMPLSAYFESQIGMSNDMALLGGLSSQISSREDVAHFQQINDKPNNGTSKVLFLDTMSQY